MRAAQAGPLEAAALRISMDGRGRWLDNVFIERLWRSLRYEEVHLKTYADGREARTAIVPDGVDAPRRHRCAKVAVLKNRYEGGVRGRG